MKRIYMDHAATTPTDPEVVRAMLPFWTDVFGNPSSVHQEGREAGRAVEEARSTVAEVLGARPEEIVFTAGGTESDNLALKGVADAKKDRGHHIITSKIEHHAVLETCRFLEGKGFHVTYLDVDDRGSVDPEAVQRAITDETILVSIMHANNEIGTIQPIAAIGRIVRERGIVFHTDAVQTAGHLATKVDELDVDLLSLSAHKLYGPKGVGALYIRKGTKITPFLHGGEQERRRRASTHNVPGIVGLGRAIALAEARREVEGPRLTALRDRLIAGIVGGIEHTVLNGDPRGRLPSNVSVAIAFVEGESLVLSLDMEGIACATGSACTSLSLEPSHVLIGIGLSHELAHGTLRFSLGRHTTEEDVDHVLAVLPGIVARLRAMSPLYQKEKK
ncbi:MAG TPA: cysteine desulfurase NifS [Syntrophus sp. (in: bacteria)]|nr:cysteine desulfurase NifS [Syntrophus sp. (in: bacteria)]